MNSTLLNTNKAAASVVCLALLISLAGCETKIDASAWKTFKPTDGAFEILMPGTPKHQVQNVPTDVGNVPMHVYGVELNSGYLAYMAFSADYPVEDLADLDARELLTASRDGVLEGFGEVSGKEEKDLTLQGYPGMELKFQGTTEGKKVHIAWRFYLVENTLYQLGVLSVLSEIDTADRDKFFDSFKFSKSKPAAETTPAAETPEPATDN